MSLEEINEAAAEHWQALLDIRAKLTPDLSPAEALELELDAAVHRAHLNVIQPLRTELFIEEELMRSQFAARVASMSPEQYDRLRQRIETGERASEAVVNAPGES